MISIPLMQAVVDLALFLGNSSDDILDPDAAISELESLVATLQLMPFEEKRQFLQYLESLFNNESSTVGMTSKADFLQQLCESIRGD